jgi:very-short-patch-repair endonuclease
MVDQSKRSAFERDRDRQNQLAALGWVTLRFTWTMLVEQPSSVATQINKVVSSRLSSTHTASDGPALQFKHRNHPSEGSL